LVYTPKSYIVELDLEGNQFKAVMQDIQFHRINDKIIHIDFVEVTEGKPVITNVPVRITGNSIGIQNGGRMRLRRRYLKVSAQVANLPDEIVVDITDVDVGQYIHIRDLDFDKLEFLEPEGAMIVGVISSRAFAKGFLELEEADAAAAEAAAEGAAEGEEGEEGEEKAEAKESEEGEAKEGEEAGTKENKTKQEG
jgi:large subunit ribosomal protein L25